MRFTAPSQLPVQLKFFFSSPKYVHQALVNPSSGRQFASITTINSVGHLVRLIPTFRLTECSTENPWFQIPQERPKELAFHLLKILSGTSPTSPKHSSRLWYLLLHFLTYTGLQPASSLSLPSMRFPVSWARYTELLSLQCSYVGKIQISVSYVMQWNTSVSGAIRPSGNGSPCHFQSSFMIFDEACTVYRHYAFLWTILGQVERDVPLSVYSLYFTNPCGLYQDR